MKNKFIYVNEKLPTDFEDFEPISDEILVSWVNLQHYKPFYGIDIINKRVDFESYERDYGRTIFKWKQAIGDEILLPDEVIDLKTMVIYLNDIIEALGKIKQQPKVD